jgi:hypothetical protein
MKGTTVLICIGVKNYVVVGHWWLTLIILATQEAEIRRIMVWSQLGQAVSKTLSHKNPLHKRIKGLVEWFKV